MQRIDRDLGIRVDSTNEAEEILRREDARRDICLYEVTPSVAALSMEEFLLVQNYINDRYGLS